MPPPSSGGIAVAATLGILEHFTMGDHKPTDVDLNGGRPAVMGVHLVSEAERLAYADRDKYVADTDFVPLPGGSPNTLLNSDYLAGRAALISEQHTMGTAKPGEFGPADHAGAAHPRARHQPDQRHRRARQRGLADHHGGVGVRLVPHGGRVHPEQPADRLRRRTGRPGRRCRCPTGSSRESGRAARWRRRWCSTRSGSGRGPLYAVLGSPGGSVIIQFVVKTVVGMLDWGLDPQQAVSMVDFGAANSPKTNVGGEHPVIDTSDNGDHDPLVQGLRELGHEVDLADQSSGLSAIVRDNPGWVGGADPRREGLVMGDTR